MSVTDLLCCGYADWLDESYGLSWLDWFTTAGLLNPSAAKSNIHLGRNTPNASVQNRGWGWRKGQQEGRLNTTLEHYWLEECSAHTLRQRETAEWVRVDDVLSSPSLGGASASLWRHSCPGWRRPGPAYLSSWSAGLASPPASVGKKMKKGISTLQ